MGDVTSVCQSFGPGKRVTAVEVLEKERMDCEKEVVYLRMEGDFADKKMKPLFITVMTRKRGNE